MLARGPFPPEKASGGAWEGHEPPQLPGSLPWPCPAGTKPRLGARLTCLPAARGLDCLWPAAPRANGIIDMRGTRGRTVRRPSGGPWVKWWPRVLEGFSQLQCWYVWTTGAAAASARVWGCQ